jgi:hypothetical protein
MLTRQMSRISGTYCSSQLSATDEIRRSCQSHQTRMRQAAGTRLQISCVGSLTSIICDIVSFRRGGLLDQNSALNF